MLRSSTLLFFVFPSILGVAACSKDKDTQPDGPRLGEPIGAEVQARGSVPALSVALAVSKGQDPVGYLPTVVSAMSSAVSGCPAFVSEGDENGVGFDFTVNAGKVKVAPRPDASPGARCLSAALEGKDLGSPSTSLEGRVEIKLSSATAKAPR